MIRATSAKNIKEQLISSSPNYNANVNANINSNITNIKNFNQTNRRSQEK